MKRDSMRSGAVPASWTELSKGLREHGGEVIEESPLTIYVNGTELVTIMCSPVDQEDLALGFLKNEGLIERLQEVELIYTSKDGCCVDLWLDHPFTRPEQKIITSGCGRGVTFSDPSVGIRPLIDDLTIDAGDLYHAFANLQGQHSLYGRARGVHACGLASGETLLAVVEDIGRHNTVDKLMGRCLREGIETSGKVLLITGRVSSEMLLKTARMGCPVVASRTSPTSLSIEMAEAWNVTLIGYVRSRSLRIYTHPHRVRQEHPSSLSSGDGPEG